MLRQLWGTEFELDGINSGSRYHCLPIRIYHSPDARWDTLQNYPQTRLLLILVGEVV